MHSYYDYCSIQGSICFAVFTVLVTVKSDGCCDNIRSVSHVGAWHSDHHDLAIRVPCCKILGQAKRFRVEALLDNTCTGGLGVEAFRRFDAVVLLLHKVLLCSRLQPGLPDLHGKQCRVSL